MQETPARYLSLDEVGRSLGLSTFTVRRYVSNGLPSVKIGGRVRVAEADLAQFVASRAVVPVVPAKGAA